MNITQVKCWETSNALLKCKAEVSGDCSSHNGPNVTITFNLHTQLSCPSNIIDLELSVQLSGSSAMATFTEYLAGKTYMGEAVLKNVAGNGDKRIFNYTTTAKG